MRSKRNKKAKWITSSSSTSLAKIIKMAAAKHTSFKPAREQDRPFEWILVSNKRSDRRVAVIGEQIILSSLRHPSLNISFTINRWAHFVAMLQDINEAARFRPIERKATGRRVSFIHLDDGIYVTALYRKHIIDFCKHFAMYGESTHSGPIAPT